MEIQWMSCYVQWIQSIYILHSFVWHTPEEKSLFHRSFVSWARNIFSVSSNLSSFASSVCYVLYISLFFFSFLIELPRFRNIYVDVGIIQFVTYFHIQSHWRLPCHERMALMYKKMGKKSLCVPLNYHTEIEHRFT